MPEFGFLNSGLYVLHISARELLQPISDNTFVSLNDRYASQAERSQFGSQLGTMEQYRHKEYAQARKSRA